MYSFINEGISSLGEALERLKAEDAEEVTSLNLHGNKIQKIENVPEFASLTVLRLSSNHIFEIQAGDLKFGGNLEYLDLASNYLSVSGHIC